MTVGNEAIAVQSRVSALAEILTNKRYTKEIT